jgi:hypothetical protein
MGWGTGGRWSIPNCSERLRTRMDPNRMDLEVLSKVAF